MANTKLSAFFSLLLVFFSGAVVGVFGYRAYNTTTVVSPAAPPKKQDPEVRRKQLIDEDTKELNLTPAQVENLEKVYDGTKTKFDDLHNRMNQQSRSIRDEQIAAIKSFLTPEQVVLYDKLRAKREAQREHMKGGPPPGR